MPGMSSPHPPSTRMAGTATMPWFSRGCCDSNQAPRACSAYPMRVLPGLLPQPFLGCGLGPSSSPRKVAYLAAPGMSQDFESQAEGSRPSHTCRPGGLPGSLWPS